MAKLAEHGITPEEVRQVNDGDRIVIRNPRPRVEGSLLMIGPTHLTVVLNPEPLDTGAWHVRTGWDAGVALDHPLPAKLIVEHHVTVQQDDEITSDELDSLIDEAETIDVGRPEGGTEVRLFVPVDPDTLHELEQRAAAQGAELTEVAAEALRAGARAA